MKKDNISASINSCTSFTDFTGGYLITSGTYTPTIYQPYYWYSCPQNTTEQAYKIVRALMKAKLVKITTLNSFFDLMDEITKVL